MEPCGLLNINKPTGWTSRDVVNWIQKLRRRLKAGHAGTLDPLASGVLVVGIGTATRLTTYVQAMRKRYDATFLLGRQSPTEDVDGLVTELISPPIPTCEAIRNAAGAFIGQISQRPPDFSALKLQGRRAYDLARAGQTVHLEPRPVMIYRLDVVAYEYPELRLIVECGSGTYIRSLGRDLAVSLGTAAVMSKLTRTAIGGFSIEAALPVDCLHADDWLDRLLPPLRAVEGLPRTILTDAEIASVQFGQAIAREFPEEEANPVAAVSADGRLVAILVRPRSGTLEAGVQLAAVGQAFQPDSV